jgi:hypothetical protein
MKESREGQARPLPWYGWVGLCVLVAGEVGLYLDILAVRILYYCIAWWSYIILADALVWKRRGDSLLRNRAWEFLVLTFWSVAIWNVFEVFNLRLKNWFYVNVPTQFIYGAIFTFLAYATVIPGIFETYDLLRAYGIAEKVRMRPWRVRPSLLALLLSTGVAMFVSPIVWPRYAFPWVWGFTVFLLDPMCYKTLSPRTNSLLAQFERGDPRAFLRLLLAGVICGGLWEFWNFWAHTKWIYTVPFFEDFKWFEMPPLGFLGFPPFAVECYVLVNFINRFRKGRGWEDSAQVGPGASRSVAWAAVALACLFNIAVYTGIDRLTVQSYSPSLVEMEGVPEFVLTRLARAGITTPHELLKRTAKSEKALALSDESGIAKEELGTLRRSAELVDLKGLGAFHYNTLRRLGITSVKELASQDAEGLRLRWRAVGGSTTPSLAQIKVWVRAARRQEKAFGSSGVR